MSGLDQELSQVIEVIPEPAPVGKLGRIFRRQKCDAHGWIADRNKRLCVLSQRPTAHDKRRFTPCRQWALLGKARDLACRQTARARAEGDFSKGISLAKTVAARDLSMTGAGAKGAIEPGAPATPV